MCYIRNVAGKMYRPKTYNPNEGLCSLERALTSWPDIKLPQQTNNEVLSGGNLLISNQS